MEQLLIILANERYPDQLEQYAATFQRPVRLMGQEFVSEDAARAEMRSRREDFLRLTPVILGTDLAKWPAPEESSRGLLPSRPSGRGVRFASSASLIGKEGEQYVEKQLRACQIFPPKLGVVQTIEIFDVSTPEAVKKCLEAMKNVSTNIKVKTWYECNRSRLDLYPGFDLLWIYANQKNVYFDGIEVKSSVETVEDSIVIELSENERRAASDKKKWLVDCYRICCVGRLWQLDQNGQLVAPQVCWLSDPETLIAQGEVEAKEHTSVRHVLRAKW